MPFIRGASRNILHPMANRSLSQIMGGAPLTWKKRFAQRDAFNKEF